MPRFPKPWYRRDRRRWFVQIDGRQVNLGLDRDAAFRRYHELMNRPRRPKNVSADTVLAVIDSFLDWCQNHRAPDTFEWYRQRLQAFADQIPPTLLATQLRPFHVQEWIDGMEGITDGTKRNYCRSIQRAMRWAEQQGYIDRSPIAHLEKPKQGKRDQVVKPFEFKQILSHVSDQEFQDLLETTWETGCRPQELLRVEARHVDLQNARWVVPPTEAKGNQLARIVYLTEKTLLITKRLMMTHREGPLFRNTRGRPWTSDAVNCRFTTLEKKLGKRFCLYVLRHSWATRALEQGVDSVTVAVLLGHSDPSMLARVYQHLSQNPEYLRNALRRVSG